MSQSQDYKELYELLDFAFAFQEAMTGILKDGKVTWTDAKYFFPVLGKVRAFFKNVGNPVARFRNLTELESDKLVSFAATKFDLPNSALEALIEQTLEEIVDDIRIVQRWARFRKAA